MRDMSPSWKWGLPSWGAHTPNSDAESWFVSLDSFRRKRTIQRV